MRAVRTERAILAVVVFITLFAQVFLYPGLDGLVTALGAETGLDASMWFLAAEFGAFIAFAVVWGFASDRAGARVPFIALGALGAAICYLVLAIGGTLGSFSFETVLFIRVVQGTCTIGAFSLSMTMLMDLRGGHGRNMGAAGIAIGAGAALGAPLGGALSSIGALVPLFTAGAMFLVIIPMVWLVRDRAPGSDRPRVTRILTDLVEHPSLSIPYAFGFVDRLTAGMFSLVGVFYFGDQFGLDPMGVGLMLMLFFGPFALLQYPFGIVSDRIGRLIPVVGGSICYGIGIMAVGLTGDLVATAVIMLFIGVFGAFVSPATMALVTDIAPEVRRGTAMGGFNIAGSLGFLTGILLGGTLADLYGFPTAFIVVGSLEVLIALVALPLFHVFAIESVPQRWVPLKN